MKHLLTAGMIAATALLCAIPAQAQPSGKRAVYCQPRPICPYGQTSVCQLFGEKLDDCRCTRWSRCFGQLLTPPGQRPPPKPIPPKPIPPKPIAPKIEPRAVL
jgi:hypothetical protein